LWKPKPKAKDRNGGVEPVEACKASKAGSKSDRSFVCKCLKIETSLRAHVRSAAAVGFSQVSLSWAPDSGPVLSSDPASLDVNPDSGSPDAPCD
jgi:hypothetical protein